MDTEPDHLTPPRWRGLTTRADVADALLELYAERGSVRYDPTDGGEAVNQTEHAVQSAALAMANRASDVLVVAALLHDVGHLLMADPMADRDDGRRRMERRHRDLRHEEVGSRFLARWFDGDVILPIRLHVPAKRVLCTVDPAYHAVLSPASVRSLELQGGTMTEPELDHFRCQPHADEALELRRWDDRAKTPGAPAPALGVFRPLVVDVMRRPLP